MKTISMLIILSVFFNCGKADSLSSDVKETKTKSMSENIEKAYLAGGCFWCTEAVFQKLDGVKSVVSGYMGGSVENPTYEQVCTGSTGHAELIEVTFDSNSISFGTLLEVFFAIHDPTTLNRQGNDVGTQYRSAIFYTNESQKKLSESYIELLNNDKVYGAGKVVVTEVSPVEKFYKAENYHQNYYNQNKLQPYCFYVITPKVDKLEKQFGKWIKK